MGIISRCCIEKLMQTAQLRSKISTSPDKNQHGWTTVNARRLYSKELINRMSFPGGISNYNNYVVADFCNERSYIRKPWRFLWKQTCTWQESPDVKSFGYPNTSDFLPRTFGNEMVKWKVLVEEVISWRMKNKFRVVETVLCDWINNLPKMNGN